MRTLQDSHQPPRIHHFKEETETTRYNYAFLCKSCGCIRRARMRCIWRMSGPTGAPQTAAKRVHVVARAIEGKGGHC